MAGPEERYRVHECEYMPVSVEVNDTVIRKDLLDGEWELVDTTDSFYLIKYCPYCGKELNVD